MRVKFGFYEITSGQQREAGESPIREAMLVEWKKKIGDKVKKGEPILYFETDKIDTDLESPVSGTIVEIWTRYALSGSQWRPGREGGKSKEKLPDGATLYLPSLGVIETEEVEESFDSPESDLIPKKRFTPVAWNMVQKDGLDPQELVALYSASQKITKEMIDDFLSKKEPETSRGATTAVPAARRLAREEGINISEVTGTGDDGLVLLQDIEQHLTQIKKPTQSPTDIEAVPPQSKGLGEELEDRVPLGASQLRKTIARFMARSHEIPQYGGSIRLNATRLWKFRETHKRCQGITLRYDHIFGFLAAKLLAHRKFRIINGYWDKAKQDAYLFNDVNLGFAVETGETEKDSFGGLMVPVVHGADKMKLLELMQFAENRVSKIKTGTITLPELRDLTFTINNVGGKRNIETDSVLEFIEKDGVFGDSGIAHSAVPYTNDSLAGERPTGMILVLGEIFWESGQAYMWISYRFDHRLMDGGPPRRFVSALKKYIESKRSSDDFTELFEPSFSLL